MSFRKIRGHIVHINDEKQRKKEGAAAVVVGAGVGFTAGRKAAAMMHESALAENAAREHTARARQFKSAGPLFENATKTSVSISKKLARESSKKSALLEKAAFKVRGVGIVASTGLITAGVDRLRGEKKNEDKVKRAVESGAIGGATAFGVHSAYSHGVGLRGVKKVSHAFKKVMKV